MIGFLRHSLIIAGKDLAIELRARERIISMLTYAVLVAVVFSFSLDVSVRPRSIAGAMIWVTILFSGMLGLGRSFSVEREQDTLIGVLLTPIDRGALYFGKLLANLALLLVATIGIFLVYALFFQLVLSQIVGLALVSILACTGFMALGTLFSAIAASTRMGDTLLPIMLLPLLIPVVIYGVSSTQSLLIDRPLSEVMGSVRMLAAFDIVFIIVCTMIFGSVMEE
jgi:heme exporter protein B